MKRILLSLVLAALLSNFGFAQDLAGVTQLYNDAAAALNDGDKNTAIELFKEALTQAEQVGPDAEEIIVDCQSILSSLYLANAKELTAAKDYTNAIPALELTAKQAEIYGQFEVAEEALDLSGKVYMMLGNANLTKKEYTQAIENYSKSIEFNPNNGMTYLRLGMAYSRIEDEANTLAAMLKASELGQKKNADKELARFYLLLANSNLKAKKYTLANEYATKSLAYGDNAQAHNICGKALFSENKYSAAISSLEAYLAAEPNAKDSKQTIYQLAVSYEALNNKAKACGYYKQIMNDPALGQYATHKVKQELKCN